MPRPAPGLIYVGIKRTVVAFDRRDGTEVWRTALDCSSAASTTFVCVYRDGDLLFATCSGELFCLDPKTGYTLWHDPLKRLGLGLTSITGEFGGGAATSGLAATVAAEVQRQQVATAATTAAAAG